MHRRYSASDQGDSCEGQQAITGSALPARAVWLPGEAFVLLRPSPTTRLGAAVLSRLTHGLTPPGTLRTVGKSFPAEWPQARPVSGSGRRALLKYDAHGI